MTTITSQRLPGAPDRTIECMDACARWMHSGDITVLDKGARYDHIAHYKIPRYIEFVDDFPMTVSGKAQKFLMREAMVQRLHLAAVQMA